MIPRIVVKGKFGQKEYGILLTTKRSLLVLQSSDNIFMGWFLGGIGGAIAASSLNAGRSIDYRRTEIKKLLKDSKNISIRHSRLSRLVLKKKGSTYTLKMEYDRKGKNRRLLAKVTPPAELVRQRKQEGLSRDEIFGAYAMKSKMAFERAVPADEAHKMKWRI